ncbi:hypothetical protein [Arthrobacter sp. M4]|uniref:hypothetical protein n=1 Tax=Arthrobacter sp. M4 TaxID=218160 RepID=UPI001CDB7551|nr:hypothetical protein [Arthrobacter sp. M4]MCA4133281.1 hypothetical protein [Arthrobacter sp. M4]
MYSYRSSAGGSELRRGSRLHSASQPGKDSEPQKEKDKLFKGLALRRQLISQVSSTVRTLTARRNEQIAQALEDGLTVAKIAALTGESAWTIRTIGLSYEGLFPSRTTRDAHLSAIQASTAELSAADRKRKLLETQRERLIARAYQLTDADVLDLAIASGMTLENVQKTTRRRAAG